MRQLERCGICFTRHLIFTARNGDDILTVKSAHISAEPDKLCRDMLDAFPEDSISAVYTPLHDGYYSSVAAGAVNIDSFHSVSVAVEAFKSFIFAKIGETYFSPADESRLHVLFTTDIKVAVSATDIDSLAVSIFRLEEIVKQIRRADLHRDEVIRAASNREAEAVKRHLLAESGAEGYLGKLKNRGIGR